MMTFTPNPSRMIPVVIDLIVRGQGGRYVGPGNRLIELIVDSDFEICINNKTVIYNINSVLSEMLKIPKNNSY